MQACWRKRCLAGFLLLPLAWLFAALVALRRLAYRRGWLARVHIGVPVIVVGNITAGGSGKTPIVIWLVEWLKAQGWRPGVVSRGYGGTLRGCAEVAADSDPRQVGDEPLLIRRKTGQPVVVGRDRVAAARMLVARHPGVDVIVSDDGLQHYRLARELELAVIDSATGLGNGWPLPAGPLREPVSRLAAVDAVLAVERSGEAPAGGLPVPAYRVRFEPGCVYRLEAPGDRRDPRSLADRSWRAVTGIGRPEGFFALLEGLGWRVTTRAFPDHHAFTAADIPARGPVVMTEKDAVKCAPFAQRDWWALELAAQPEAAFIDWLQGRIGTWRKKNETGVADVRSTE